eukprot:m.230947 g.230947  ORF g.230947 m.230947 type:complete len:57 (+) comp17359_c0_seq8:3466-3636(+)
MDAQYTHDAKPPETKTAKAPSPQRDYNIQQLDHDDMQGAQGTRFQTIAATRTVTLP